MPKIIKEVQPKLVFTVLTDDDARFAVGRMDSGNPFRNFVGNDDVVNKLSRFAYSAMMREDHFLDAKLAFLGPAGTGKTSAAKKLAELVDTPFVNVNPTSIKSVHDLFLEIGAVLSASTLMMEDGTVTSLALRPQQNEYTFLAPPMIVFIDEGHMLKSDLQQGLLTATDDNHILVTEEGCRLDTRYITWIFATTESGQMFHALRSRFTKVQFKGYGQDELAMIVRIDTGLNMEVCKGAAFYCGRVTREAIAFAKEVALEQRFSGGSWAEAIEVIRNEHGIDEFGMQDRRLNILKALGSKGAISKSRLLGIARCQIEELEQEVLPPLTEFSDVSEALVTVTPRGFQITEAGKEELLKRGIISTIKAA